VVCSRNRTPCFEDLDVVCDECGMVEVGRFWNGLDEGWSVGGLVMRLLWSWP